MPNAGNAWMQLQAKLSDTSAMDGGSVDIEGAFIDRRRLFIIKNGIYAYLSG
ncbi:hypothetical protein L1D44_21250 [Shewanella sp. Isolate13]|uniref:hypothetical protein n=1 Tax=Shewanella sp. Isolate13 TaxID=2908531 RepID=UPI001EFD4ED7|nr:hypothetical protein [Shewanella sp. Isolate13]MCG9732312.1 hypothetical protein [Shewanella sp. Isolate13]